jgi:hypothetical protein
MAYLLCWLGPEGLIGFFFLVLILAGANSRARALELGGGHHYPSDSMRG